MEHPDWTQDGLTYGDILGPAMKAQTKAEADDFRAQYMAYIMRMEPDMTVERARQVVQQNIGYYSGYYGKETSQRVLDLYMTAHPVFGRRKPTSEEALEAGRNLAEGL